MCGLAGILHFDGAPVERGTLYNWRVDSSAPTLRSFRAMATDPYFSASPP